MNEIRSELRSAGVRNGIVIDVGDGENSATGSRSLCQIVPFVFAKCTPGVLFVGGVVKSSIAIIPLMHLRDNGTENINSGVIDFYKGTIGHS